MSIEDTLYPLLKLYKKLPYPIKYTLGKLYRILPRNVKYGRFYYFYLERIKTFTAEKEESLLAQQLKVAIEKIPFYQNKTLSYLNEFPIINKHIINESFKSFVNPNLTNRIKTNTGGSSGDPLEFYLEKGVSRPKEKGHFDWYWGMFGYISGDKILMIRGESLAGEKIVEYQPIENRLAVSCYLLNNKNIDAVIRNINKFKPKFIHAYPSALTNFINLSNMASVSLKVNIQAALLGSEALYHNDRELIGTYFNTKIAHWYGQSERLVHAGNCPFSENFHIFPFYGLAELIDEKDNVITAPEIKGRIVATGFDNSAMPFLRYDTGDEAEYAKETTCECGFKGRSFRIIHGRKQDYIYLDEGTKVSLTAFIFGQHFKEFSAINEIQLQQEKKGGLIIRIVLKENHNFDSDSFVQKLERSVQGKITVNLEIVESIVKTQRGKHVFLIQNIKNV